LSTLATGCNFDRPLSSAGAGVDAAAALLSFREERLHNFGMLWTRGAFRRHFLPHVHAFATYGDHNWDWTLGWLMQRGALLPHTVRPDVSRLLHLGRCGGTHYTKDATKSAEQCRADMIEAIASFERVHAVDVDMQTFEQQLRAFADAHRGGRGLAFTGAAGGSAPVRTDNAPALVAQYEAIVRRLVPVHIGYEIDRAQCPCNGTTTRYIYDMDAENCRGYIDCEACTRYECPAGQTFDGQCTDIAHGAC
jgi:hypothetical protein